MRRERLPDVDGLRVEMLGGFRALRNGCVHTRFRTQKTASLLAYLALNPRTRHSRDTLVELFWPEDDFDAARHSLNVAIWSLRRLLDGGPHPPIIETTRLNIGLNPDLLSTDVGEFEAAAERANGDPDALDAALGAYRGDFLPGHYEDWIQPVRDRLAERHLALLRRRILLAEARGAPETALQSALRAAERDPLREELHAEILRLYALNGEPGAAREHLARAEALFRRELGRPPSAALRLLLPDPDRRSAGPGAAHVLSAASGGALPVSSPFYVRRSADDAVAAAVERDEGIILVKGSARMGKSSLLARTLPAARAAGLRAANVDLDAIPAHGHQHSEVLYAELTSHLRDQLELPAACAADAAGWSPTVRFERFLRLEALSPGRPPLLWTLDGVDALFGTAAGTDLFRQIRSWHNARALDPEGPWSRLRVILAYASEVHLFIRDLNQSPFNVGARIVLDDLDPAQVADLNFRRGSPLGSREEVARLMEVVGGHPHLVQIALQALAARAAELETLEESAERDDGPFAPHLRAVLAALRRDESLAAELAGFLTGRRRISPDAFYRLRSAGLLSGQSEADARPRCRLYRRFFQRRLCAAAGTGA